MRFSVSILLLLFSTASCGEDSWIPMQDVSLMIEENSALDFSALNPTNPLTESDRLIINSRGRISRKQQPEKDVKFLMASLGFAPVNGGIPDPGTVDMYVKQLQLRGYNMARLDYIEGLLMNKRIEDFDFDPKQLDRFHYLLAALRKAGIYYVLNGVTGDNGGFGNIQNRWKNNKNLRIGLYYDRQKQEHWKTLLRKIFGEVNPYTGEVIARDPAFAGLILVNEGGLEYLTRDGADSELVKVFNDWLRIKYGNTDALSKAWKKELRKGETLDNGLVALPRPADNASPRMADAQRFFVDLERKSVDWMTDFVRNDLRYPGLLTAFNNWNSPAAHMARQSLQWVDMHNYAGLPTSFTNKRSYLKQNSILSDDLKYIRELAATRQWGKPFTVSEYGQIFWNKYRYETSLAVPAYASFQAWDMICQHAEPIGLSYASNSARRDAIYPFVVALDPIARVTEVMSSLLYLRGDVKPYRQSFNIQLPQEFSLDQGRFLGNIPGDISRVSLLSGVGLGNAKGATVSLLPANTEVLTKGKIQSIPVSGLVASYVNKSNEQRPVGVNVMADQLWSARIDSLAATTLIDENISSKAKGAVYLADNNQIVLNRKSKWLKVETDSTEAMVFSGDSRPDLKHLAVDIEQMDRGLIAISAIDGKPIIESKRLLLVLASDARNSDMRFSDADEAELVTLGRLPVLLKRMSLKLSVMKSPTQQVKAYALNQRGQRMDQLKITIAKDRVVLDIDTGNLPHGPTTYFELIF